MTDGLVEAALGVYGRLWPSLLGAVIALYFHPAGATRSDRLFAGAASVGVSVLFGPWLIEYYEVDSETLARTIHGALALFGLTAIGQVFESLRELGLPAMVRQWARRRFGLDDGPGDG